MKLARFRAPKPTDVARPVREDVEYRGFTIRPRFSGGYIVMLQVRSPAGDMRQHVVSEHEDTLPAAKGVVDEVMGEDVPTQIVRFKSTKLDKAVAHFGRFSSRKE